MKTLISLLLVQLLFLSAFAQNTTEDNREKLQFGIKAGASFSNVYDERGDDFIADGKIGAVAGVALSIPIGRYLGFQPEALFIQKGFDGNAVYNNNNYSLKRTTNHIDFPLQLKFKPAKNFSILGGPQYSFLISRKDVFDGSLTVQDQQDIEDYKLNENIFGYVVGAEVNINKVIISGKAGWDAKENHDDNTTTIPRYKNSWVQLTLGLMF